MSRGGPRAPASASGHGNVARRSLPPERCIPGREGPMGCAPQCHIPAALPGQILFAPGLSRSAPHGKPPALGVCSKVQRGHPMWVVEAEGLAKTFVTGWLRPRRRVALTGVSLRVAPGTIYGIVGPNGAGKTTLLSILATILTPDTGRATLLGHDLGREPAAIRQRLNLVSGHPPSEPPRPARDAGGARPGTQGHRAGPGGCVCRICEATPLRRALSSSGTSG